jgi:hypothetical protein
MMWKTAHRSALASAFAMLALAAATVGCNDDRAGSREILAPDAAAGAPGADAKTYDQIEFLGNPLVSEVTIAKANHDAYNRTQPYNTATFRPQTEAFVTSFGRPAALASLLGSVLYPDMLVVDASKNPATAGWLSWALANGWGGRKLTDDVVDLGLTAIFSSFLDPAGAFCAPFQLPLCTDNVNANDKQFLSTFPYLARPHAS